MDIPERECTVSPLLSKKNRFFPVHFSERATSCFKSCFKSEEHVEVVHPKNNGIGLETIFLVLSKKRRQVHRFFSDQLAMSASVDQFLSFVRFLSKYPHCIWILPGVYLVWTWIHWYSHWWQQFWVIVPIVDCSCGEEVLPRSNFRVFTFELTWVTFSISVSHAENIFSNSWIIETLDEIIDFDYSSSSSPNIRQNQSLESVSVTQATQVWDELGCSTLYFLE